MTSPNPLPAGLEPEWPRGSVRQRALAYLAWLAVTCLLLLGPLARFVQYALANDNSSHTILIPAICAWILYLERDRIFAKLGSDRPWTLGFLAAGGAMAALGRWGTLSELNRLSAYVLALILFWTGGFAFFFGRSALKRARFSLVFLLLTIPIPDFLLDPAIYFLQKGTAEIAAVLFDLTGVPVLREGFVFHLARVSIEVARECSGIRSSLALLILAILVARFYLKTLWRQVVLVVAGLFVMILKNGVRIVTLTLLATYVDPAFLQGNLHREGGVAFFLLGLLLLAPLVWLLGRSEVRSLGATNDGQSRGSPAG